MPLGARYARSAGRRHDPTVPERVPQNNAAGLSPIAGSEPFAMLVGLTYGSLGAVARWVHHPDVAATQAPTETRRTTKRTRRLDVLQHCRAVLEPGVDQPPLCPRTRPLRTPHPLARPTAHPRIGARRQWCARQSRDRP